MRLRRQVALAILAIAVIGVAGCHKKRVSAAPPPPPAVMPAAAPPVEPSPGPPPPVNAEPNRPMPAAIPEPAKPKPQRRTRTAIARKPPDEPPPRAVVPPAPAQPPAGQLSPGLTHDDAIHRRFSTAQLLETTEYNLKSITRSLNADEQATVQHIRSYIQQSRSATESGDVERAYNLALKAHLLSDELLKQ